MVSDGSNGFKVTTLREARYVSAYLRFASNQDWVSISLPEKATDAVAECKRQISQVLSLQNGQQFMTEVFNHMRCDLIPESCFEWITEGEDRAVYFVEHSLKRGVGDNPIARLSGMDFIYAFNDLVRPINQWFKNANKPFLPLSVEQQQKELALENLKQLFEQKPDLSWIGKMTEDQLKWAVSYLVKNPVEMADFFNVSFPRPADSASYETIKKYVFCALDQPNASQDRLDNYLTKMKSALASKKNRGKGRNLNYPVSSDAFEQLGEIAKDRGISKAKVVDWLIREEYKRMGR